MVLSNFSSHGGYETKLLVRFDPETGEEVSDYTSLVVRNSKGYGGGHAIGAYNYETGKSWVTNLK